MIDLGTQTLTLPNGGEVDVRIGLAVSLTAYRPPSPPPPPPAPAVPAPVAYWKFNGDLADASGNGRDLAGTVTYDAGQFGQALASGETNRNPSGVLAGSPINGTYSFAGRAKITNGMSGNAYVTLTGADGANVTFAGNSFSVGLTANSAGFAAFVSVTAPSPGLNTWFHLAVVVTGGTARIYLNGSEAASGSVAALAGNIGAEAGAGAIGGLLDDAAIWDVALSAGEVAAIAAAAGDLSTLL